MAITQEKNYNNVQGGVSKLDPQDIDDNQFSVLKNFRYDEKLRLITVDGYSQIFNSVPDSVLLVDDCEDVTDWSVSGDASNLTLDNTNEIRGAGCLNFDISAYSTGSSKLTLSASSTIDISSLKGYMTFWAKFPTGYDTDLISIVARIGSDSSNYYEWTLTNPTAATNSYFKLDFSDATSTGTPVDTAIDFFELEFTTDTGYVGYTDFLLDSIYVYSSTSTKPVTSGHFWQNSVNLNRNTIIACGENMFLLNEDTSSWEVIETGLTEYETTEGRTDEVTKWEFMTYNTDSGNNNDIVYFLNGVDNYRSWNGTAITDHGQIMGRYIRNVNTYLVISGDDTQPNIVKRTAALPDDATPARFSATTLIGKYDEGKINGLNEISNLVLVFKDSKSYSLDASSGAVVPIDSQNGGFSTRAISNVENGLIYFNGEGIDFLEQKDGAVGGQALISTLRTNVISDYFKDIKYHSKNCNCGIYMKDKHDYLIQIDTNNDNIPDTTLIYSSLNGAWTEIVLPNAYQFIKYIDSNGQSRYLLCSADSGILYEIYSGLNANGGEYECRIETKEHNFNDITLSKYFESIDLIGFKSIGGPITVEVYVDDTLARATLLTDKQIDKNSSQRTISSLPIGVYPLTGESISATTELTLYKYMARVNVGKVGRKVKVVLYTESSNLAWTLSRYKFGYDPQTLDVFPKNNII